MFAFKLLHKDKTSNPKNKQIGYLVAKK